MQYKTTENIHWAPIHSFGFKQIGAKEIVSVESVYLITLFLCFHFNKMLKMGILLDFIDVDHGGLNGGRLLLVNCPLKNDS